MKASRRSFMILGASAAASLAYARLARADAQRLSESDPNAKQLGYVEDASKVDKGRYSNYAAGQECSNCSLYQGQPGDDAGGCTLFGAKRVAAHGWCSSYSNL
ncbi:high-potential iron-sulfur protein [Pararobbsia silviterrae]|uniref:High-potential iron-sulfur protein n=1 Tax=Pararobbsia silviterrae TaxID=1792498 RepID=A0A494XYK8_9BURK|nr:high-potential iron-sulfur protein [Pararobbsia silviterrae]RKP55675.1 High potential iron-sulfur protein [Pararobbsia silviterrae]